MKRTEIKQLLTQPYTEGTVYVAGWIRTARQSSKVGFIELNDGSQFGNLQIVYDKDLANFNEINKLGLSAAIEVWGEVVLTPEMKQPLEIRATKIEVMGDSAKDYPLQKKRHSLEYLRTQLTLRPRTNTFMAVFRVRSVLSMAIHQFFQDRGFVYVHTPILTSADAEGAGEMFQVTSLDLNDLPMTEDGRVDYSKELFGKKMGLTVSGQLAVEPFALSFSKVYTFGPTFRAENSNTVRHANEFWMIEPEISFCDLDCMMDIIEEMVKYLIDYVLEQAPQEMQFFNDRIDNSLLERLEVVRQSRFARISYTEAIELLQASGKSFEFKPVWGQEIQTEHEKYLAGEYFKQPVFVTDYPTDAKAFYMKLSDDGKTVRACDLLVPAIGEIVGGSQREDDFERLKAEMERRGMPTKEYQWYLDLRRYGSAVHSGFGLGFDRIIQYLTGIANIRDVQAYPRTPHNAEH